MRYGLAIGMLLFARHVRPRERVSDRIRRWWSVIAHSSADVLIARRLMIDDEDIEPTAR